MRAAAGPRAHAHPFSAGCQLLPPLAPGTAPASPPPPRPARRSPKFTLRASRGLDLPIHGDGGAVRSYLYVEDVAEAYITVLLKGTVGETYNIGTQKERSVVDVARDICKVFNRDPDATVKHVRDRAFNDRRYFICDKKVRREGGRRRGSRAAAAEWSERPLHMDALIRPPMRPLPPRSCSSWAGRRRPPGRRACARRWTGTSSTPSASTGARLRLQGRLPVAVLRLLCAEAVHLPPPPTCLPPFLRPCRGHGDMELALAAHPTLQVPSFGSGSFVVA